jgi:HEAT repeat protein
MLPALVMALAGPVVGDDPVAPATGDELTDELIARERIRAAVETLLDDYLQPAPDGDVRTDMAIRAVEGFVAVGPDVVPYLINELEQEKHATFDLCSYALGMLGTPEAAQALRDAIARADEEPGDPARSRKAWAAWGLGLAGDAASVSVLTEGRHRVAIHPMHGKTTLMEAVAIQTAPDSVPVLLEALKLVARDPDRWQERRAVLRALRRVGDRSAVPHVIALLDHTDRTARREAVNTLRTMATPEAVAALVRSVGEEDFTVRRSSAAVLAELGVTGHEDRFLERLEQEIDVPTRGALYRLLAETGGSQIFDRLIRFRGRSDVNDRRYLVEALAHVDHPGRMPFLREAIADESNDVALRAVFALGRLGEVEALANAVATARLPVARSAAQLLAGLDATRSAAVIADRVKHLLADPVTEPRQRVPLEKMLAALVRLGHTEATRSLRQALDGQPQAGLRLLIESVTRQLDAIRRNGRRVARWVETSRSEDTALRQLAWTRLGRIANAEATRALLEAFDAAERADRSAILGALGHVSREQAARLLERVLLDPAFDDPHEAELRDMAAWSARRIGGDAMFELLEAASRRRHGRDARVLLYAAVVGGERALPLLRDLRKPRMRYLGWTRGIEQERLDRVAQRLAAGRPIDDVDVPPHKLVFR